MKFIVFYCLIIYASSSWLVQSQPLNPCWSATDVAKKSAEEYGFSLNSIIDARDNWIYLERSFNGDIFEGSYSEENRTKEFLVIFRATGGKPNIINVLPNGWYATKDARNQAVEENFDIDKIIDLIKRYKVLQYEKKISGVYQKFFMGYYKENDLKKQFFLQINLDEKKIIRVYSAWNPTERAKQQAFYQNLDMSKIQAVLKKNNQAIVREGRETNFYSYRNSYEDSNGSPKKFEALIDMRDKYIVEVGSVY